MDLNQTSLTQNPKAHSKNFKCAVPENIHTPPTEGIRISWGWGGGGFGKTKKFKEMYEA